MARMRDTLYRSFKRSRSVEKLYSYREVRDAFHKRVSAARANFYQTRLSSLTSSRALWSELRTLGIASATANSYGNFSVDDLNVYFASVSQNPSAASEVTELITSHSRSTFNDTAFYFLDIDPLTLLNAISHFSSQSRGVDDLSLRNINEALPSIFPQLLALYNHSLSSATYPKQWKRALVRPLGKVKSPVLLEQVRPIANLCLLSKVLERIVCEQISTYLDQHQLLDSRQSGFRTGYSTQTALLRLTEDIRMAIDKRKLTLLLLFDFSKAFDSISHSILLGKLAKVGFSHHALCWIANYLQGRSQAVIGTDGSVSGWLPLHQGVPQGSVLGPLLFSIYINDISEVLSHSSHLIYADDLQIYLHCTHDNLPEAINKISSDASAVLAWSSASRLRLNLSKTHSMIFGSSAYISRIDLTGLNKITISGAPVSYVDTVRNLGLHMDSKLTWLSQVNIISMRFHATLRQLADSRRLLPPALRSHLVVTLLFPILDYCSVVYNDLSGVLNLRLQRLQNTAVRFVTGVARDEHITQHRRSLGWLTVKDRRRYFLLTLFFSVIRSGKPCYLRDLFADRNPAASRSARIAQSDFLSITRRTETLNKSFMVVAVRLWDSLPVDVKTASTKQAFRLLLYEHLFNTENLRS